MKINLFMVKIRFGKESKPSYKFTLLYTYFCRVGLYTVLTNAGYRYNETLNLVGLKNILHYLMFFRVLTIDYRGFADSSSVGKNKFTIL
jgi:hypothetical protein